MQIPIGERGLSTDRGGQKYATHLTFLYFFMELSLLKCQHINPKHDKYFKPLLLKDVILGYRYRSECFQLDL